MHRIAPYRVIFRLQLIAVPCGSHYAKVRRPAGSDPTFGRRELDRLVAFRHFRSLRRHPDAAGG
jgi:hypothetical protein